MHPFDFIKNIDVQVQEYVDEHMTRVRPGRVKMGLDERAAYELFINDGAIAVSKSQDRTLQYYGGFEYVDKEARQELGNYVFYMAEDDRVLGHIERYQESLEDTQDAA